VTYLTGSLYVHPLWFYKHQHENRVLSKLFVACQHVAFSQPFAAILVNCTPSGEMHNYCTPHIIKENYENFLIHLCNYILLSQVYCLWQVVKIPAIILNNSAFVVFTTVVHSYFHIVYIWMLFPTFNKTHTHVMYHSRYTFLLNNDSIESFVCCSNSHRHFANWNGGTT